MWTSVKEQNDSNFYLTPMQSSSLNCITEMLMWQLLYTLQLYQHVLIVTSLHTAILILLTCTCTQLAGSILHLIKSLGYEEDILPINVPSNLTKHHLAVISSYNYRNYPCLTWQRESKVTYDKVPSLSDYLNIYSSHSILYFNYSTYLYSGLLAFQLYAMATPSKMI